MVYSVIAFLQGVQRIRELQQVQPLRALPGNARTPVRNSVFSANKSCLMFISTAYLKKKIQFEGNQAQVLTEGPRGPAGPAGPKAPLSPCRREG